MIGRWVAYTIGDLKSTGMTSEQAAAHIRKRIESGHNYFRGGMDRSKEVLDYLNKYYKEAQHD